MKKRRTLLESVKQYFKEWIERNTQLKVRYPTVTPPTPLLI